MSFYQIKKGDLIEIISPSCALSKKENEAIKKLLKKHDFLPNIFEEKNIILDKNPKHEFSEFDAKIRFKQFKKSLENPKSKIIWCAKGGYGTAEILSFLPEIKKVKNKKIFIGFSDITALNKFLIEDLGYEVVIAPMLNQIAQKKISKNSINEIFNLISGQIKEISYDLEELYLKNAKINAPLTGGCLSVLCANLATKNQISWKNKILFLEDEGEDGERLDRYFYQIFTIIKETKSYPKAIILGNFLHANPHGTPKAKNIEIAIQKLVKNFKKEKLPIPILQEKANLLGHSKNMMPIILGKKAIISQNKIIQNV